MEQVKIERIYGAGSYVVRRFTHSDKLVLMEEVGRVRAAIDPYRSPHVGQFVQQLDGDWAVDVSHYGLD